MGSAFCLSETKEQRRKLEWGALQALVTLSPPLAPGESPDERRAETQACVRSGQRATLVQLWRKRQGRMPRFSWWNSTSCSRSVKRVWPSSMLK